MEHVGSVEKRFGMSCPGARSSQYFYPSYWVPARVFLWNQWQKDRAPFWCPGWAYSQTDRNLLRRVLVNLLDNGLKFTPEGGQLIIGAVLEQEEQQLKISVVNSGPTMSDLQLEGMFERFWQTPQGRKYGLGTGLGLFFSRQIMDMLGGSIECNITEQNYTGFTIRLDAHRASNVVSQGRQLRNWMRYR